MQPDQCILNIYCSAPVKLGFSPYPGNFCAADRSKAEFMLQFLLFFIRTVSDEVLFYSYFLIEHKFFFIFVRIASVRRF